MRAWTLTFISIYTLVASPAVADRYASCPLLPAGTRTYIPNIQSFLDYSNQYGLGWTEPQIRRELIAAAEEWTVSGEASLRVEISPQTTNLIGSDPTDGINVISMCDLDLGNCPTGGEDPAQFACGALGPYRCDGTHSLEGDVIFFYRTSVACLRWRMMNQLEPLGSAGSSVYRYLVHEIGHNLGFDHYSGPDFSVMAQGNLPYNDWTKMHLQHGDIDELTSVTTRRSAPIRYYRGTDAQPPAWTFQGNTFGTSMAGVGLMQHSYNASINVFFARNSDGAMMVDTGPNALTVYRQNQFGWGHALVQDSEIVRGQPALTLHDPSGTNIIAWRDHEGYVWISRSLGNPDPWVSTQLAARTFDTVGMAYLESVDRVYLLYSNGHPNATSTFARRIHYVSSGDGGVTWSAPSIGPAGMLLSGVGFSCLNDGVATSRQCTVVYAAQDLKSKGIRWRPVTPNPNNPDILYFEAESGVSSNFDFSTHTPATTTGRAGPGNWRNVVAFNRNANTPFTSTMAQTQSATGASYLGRTLFDGTPHRILHIDSFRTIGSPSVAHFDAWNTFYLLFVRE